MFSFLGDITEDRALVPQPDGSGGFERPSVLAVAASRSRKLSLPHCPLHCPLPPRRQRGSEIAKARRSAGPSTHLSGRSVFPLTGPSPEWD